MASLVAGLQGWVPETKFMEPGCATALRGKDSKTFGIGPDPVALAHVLEGSVFCKLEKSRHS